MRQRLKNLMVFSLLLGIEFYIALYVHDDFIRPYIGDVLVVVALYYFLRIFIVKRFKRLAFYVFLFAVAVECGQYFDFVKVLGLDDYTII